TYTVVGSVGSIATYPLLLMFDGFCQIFVHVRPASDDRQIPCVWSYRNTKGEPGSHANEAAAFVLSKPVIAADDTRVHVPPDLRQIPLCSTAPKTTRSPATVFAATPLTRLAPLNAANPSLAHGDVAGSGLAYHSPFS